MSKSSPTLSAMTECSRGDGLLMSSRASRTAATSRRNSPRADTRLATPWSTGALTLIQVWGCRGALTVLLDTDPLWR